MGSIWAALVTAVMLTLTATRVAHAEGAQSKTRFTVTWLCDAAQAYASKSPDEPIYVKLRDLPVAELLRRPRPP
jgi:hypothetical protein